jgi:hypothetical protein
MLRHVADGLLGQPYPLVEPEDAVLQQVENAGVRPAQSPGALDDGGEDHVRFARRAPQRGQHLVGGRELVGQVDEVLQDARVLLRVDVARGGRRTTFGHRFPPPPRSSSRW